MLSFKRRGLLNHPSVMVGVAVKTVFLRFMNDLECGERQEPDGAKILREVEWFQDEGVTETALITRISNVNSICVTVKNVGE